MKKLILLLLLCGSAQAETMFRIGPSQVGDKFSNSAMFSITERVQDKYDFTFGIIGPQRFDMCGRADCIWEIDTQVYVGARWLFHPLWFWTDKFKFGIGPTLWARPDRAVSSFLRANLYAEYRFNKYVAVSAEHFSIASAGLPLEFCNVQGSFCESRPRNNGLDSWAGLNIFVRF